MKGNDLLLKCQYPLLMAAAAYPLGVMAAVSLCPEKAGIMPCVSFVYAALSLVCMAAPGKLRLWLGGAASLVLLAFCFFVLPKGAWVLALMLTAVYSALIFAVLPAAGWQTGQELPPFWAVGGLVMHLLLQFLCFLKPRQYQSAKGGLLIFFLLFLLLTLLSLNRRSLDLAAQSKVQVPGGMRRQNTILTIGLLLLSLLLAVLPAVGRFLKMVWNAAVQGIAAFAGWFVSLFETESVKQAADSGGAEPFQLGGGAEIQSGQPVMEIILTVIAILALLVFAAVLAVKVARGVKWLWKKLMELLSRYGAAASRDYVDEITDTRTGEGAESSHGKNRAGQRVSRMDESRMTPAQRIRYRYLRLKRKHTEWRPSFTARDTLPPTAAALYEQVRYGGREMTKEEARRFQEETRKL